MSVKRPKHRKRKARVLNLVPTKKGPLRFTTDEGFLIMGTKDGEQPDKAKSEAILEKVKSYNSKRIPDDDSQ